MIKDAAMTPERTINIQCPAEITGQYVYIEQSRNAALALTLCEVQVYGWDVKATGEDKNKMFSPHLFPVPLSKLIIIIIKTSF